MKYAKITTLCFSFLFAPALLLGAGGADEEGAKTVVVYTYDAFSGELEENIRARLGEKGISLRMERFQDTGALFTQTLLETEKPVADVVVGLDNTYLARAIKEDLFRAYKPDALKLVSPGILVDPEYRLVPFDYGSVALNYDSGVLTAPPESWSELLEPTYKNQIIMMNPATSSPGRNFLLFTVTEFGEDGYLDFWRRLKPNILTVTSGWSEGYGLYTQGEAPIVLSYDTSPAYHMHYEDEDRYRNLLFDGKAYAQIEVAGITRKTSNFEYAKECMDHLVSVEFQELIPLNQIMYPVHADAALPEAFAWANPASHIVNMDETVVAKKLDTWLAAWEAVMR